MMIRVIIWYCFLRLVKCQACREYSESCIDDKACCGGCCIDFICRDTYEDCREGGDPCLNVYCPEDEECYIFQPKDCGGCGPSTECRSIASAPTERSVKPKCSTTNNASIMFPSCLIICYLSHTFY